MRAQIVQFWMRMTRRQRLSTPRTGWLPGTRRCWLPAHWPDLALTGGLATVFGGGNRWADGHRVTETYFRARAAQVADEWLWWPVVGGPEGIDLVGTEPGASRDGPPRLARARSPKFPHTGPAQFRRADAGAILGGWSNRSVAGALRHSSQRTRRAFHPLAGGAGSGQLAGRPGERPGLCCGRRASRGILQPCADGRPG